MVRHKLSPCAKDMILGTRQHAVEDGTEMLKLTLPEITPHLEAGHLVSKMLQLR